MTADGQRCALHAVVMRQRSSSRSLCHIAEDAAAIASAGGRPGFQSSGMIAVENAIKSHSDDTADMLVFCLVGCSQCSGVKAGLDQNIAGRVIRNLSQNAADIAARRHAAAVAAADDFVIAFIYTLGCYLADNTAGIVTGVAMVILCRFSGIQ